MLIIYDLQGVRLVSQLVVPLKLLINQQALGKCHLITVLRSIRDRVNRLVKTLESLKSALSELEKEPEVERSGKIEGVEDLAEHIAPYEALALSVPWLHRY